MTEPAPRAPLRTRKRPAAARAGVPARAREARSPGQPSLRRQVAAQVIAWHNRHPLARRIGRRQLGGYGIVSLPFSPPVEGPGASAPTRYPMFDDLSLIPGLARNKVVAMALAHGWDDRPGLPEWPLRQVPVGRGWDAAQARPIHLLTVALKRGRGKPPLRLLVGRDVVASDVSSVLGHRLLSRPRMSLLGGALALPVLLLGLGLTQLLPAGRPGLSGSPPVVAQAPYSSGDGTPGPRGGAVPQGAPIPRPGPGPAGPPAVAPPGPPTSPPPAVGDPSVPQVGPTAGPGPSVGTGVPLEGPQTRAAGPASYRLLGPAQRDPAALQAQAKQLQAALAGMGRMGNRVRVDVIGTPQGDALSVGPLPNEAEAERVAKRLQAHGIMLVVVAQP
jgi:hypothetical protein